VQNEPKRILTDALLEQLPLGVILADERGDMVFINQTAERIRNIKREKLLGKSIVNCHKKTSHANVERAMEHLLSKPDTVYRRMVDDAANGKYYVNTYASVVGHENKPIGFAVLTEDVTEKHSLERQQATSFRMMQETSESLRRRYHELLMVSLETISNLLEKRDHYTSNHSANVCRYSLRMYEHRCGIGMDYDTLKTAASLHDIGKVGIPDTILNKPGRLTETEFNVIKSHSTIAEDILKPMDAGSEISNIVRHHHEHFDGSGYPDALGGGDIPALSRVIAIADAYDAMNSDRPYRKALPFEQTIEEIKKHRGQQFDPEWTDVFLDLAMTGSL